MIFQIPYEITFFFCNITCAKKTEENRKDRVDRRKMAGRKIRRGCLVMILDNF